MYIECSNVNDFCTMITTCSANGIHDIRVFISEQDSYPPVSTFNTQKDYTQFIFVLFSPLYTAIYRGNIKNEEYEDVVYPTLSKCQDDCDHSFRIQVFDELSFNSNSGCLTVGKELNVI